MRAKITAVSRADSFYSVKEAVLGKIITFAPEAKEKSPMNGYTTIHLATSKTIPRKHSLPNAGKHSRNFCFFAIKIKEVE